MLYKRERHSKVAQRTEQQQDCQARGDHAEFVGREQPSKSGNHRDAGDIAQSASQRSPEDPPADLPAYSLRAVVPCHACQVEGRALWIARSISRPMRSQLRTT